MSDWGTALGVGLALCALVGAAFLIRRAAGPKRLRRGCLWLFSRPGVGPLIYLLFGRSEKAFSKRTKLLLQELRPHALSLLPPTLSRQDAAMVRVSQAQRRCSLPGLGRGLLSPLL